MDTTNIVASGISGALLPFIISLLKAVEWPRWAKIGLALVAALALAVAIAAATGELDLTILSNWGIIFGAASTIYTTILERSGIEDRLRDIRLW